MRKIQKRFFVLFIALFALLTLSITVSAAEYLEKLRISTVEIINLNIDEEYTFLQNYESSDKTIFKINDKVGKAVNEGTVYLTLPNKMEKKYIVNVVAKYDYINIDGRLMIDKGEKTKLLAKVYPQKLDQDVIWQSSDETIATVDDKGNVTGINYGITTIKAISKNDNTCVGKTYLLVDDDSLESYEDIVEVIYGEKKTEHIKADELKTMLYYLIDRASKSVVGVEKFINQRGFFGYKLVSSDFGSGVIYRRDAILSDKTVIKNCDDLSQTEGFDTFKYYVISSRTLVQGSAELKIYLGDENEINANLIQYDDKIDLSVISFESTEYLPTINIGDSDDIRRGEFIIAIGNGYGKEYFRTSTFGIISYTKRYAATDTDGDEVNDWDAEYIQHDASINSQSSNTTSTTTNSGGNGGALINLKGELIGINSTKISSLSVDNMSFAIPSNLVVEICNILETGNKLNRPLLGVEIVDISRFHQYESEYLAKYPEMRVIVDSGLKYGFFVNVVNEGGVGEAAGVQIGDIIIEFNEVQTKYSYELRAQLGKFIIDSGQSTTLKVWRKGEIVTLSVTF